MTLQPTSSHSSQTVMIVEDDEVIRETLEQLLRDQNYPVLTAQHGRDAIDQMGLLTERPCLLLMDLMMPVMNGWELLAELRKDPRWQTLPVIVLSAGGEAPDVGNDPHVRFLKKPIRMASLLDAVKNACGEPS